MKFFVDLVIIEPYWNWNSLIYTPGRVWKRVIIEPYWNWNDRTPSSLIIFAVVIIEPYWNWNKCYRYSSISSVGYNWTLLELKFKRLSRMPVATPVIIEPYWNWNVAYTVPFTNKTGYNWTLVELKSTFICAIAMGAMRYNWTLVELKWHWHVRNIRNIKL